MAESILFLTGHLARPRLEAVLEGMKPHFDWKVLPPRLPTQAKERRRTVEIEQTGKDGRTKKV